MPEWVMIYSRGRSYLGWLSTRFYSQRDLEDSESLGTVKIGLIVAGVMHGFKIEEFGRIGDVGFVLNWSFLAV